MNPSVLEKYRKKARLTCKDVCDRMEKTAGWYSRIKNGKQPLKSQYIPEMAGIFGIKSERLAKEYFSDNKLEDTSTLSETG